MPLHSLTPAELIRSFYVVLFDMTWIVLATLFVVSFMHWMLQWVSQGIAREEEKAAWRMSAGSRVRLRVLRGGAGETPPAVPAGRAVLRAALGVAWLCGAVLSAQYSVVSAAVHGRLLTVAAAGWPAAVAVAAAGAEWWKANPVLAQLSAVGSQGAVGLAILVFRRGMAARISAGLSAALGLAIWVFAEGFGGMFFPGASFLRGAPGAGLLLAVLSTGLLARNRTWASGRVRQVSRYGLALLFGGLALAQALPWNGYWTGQGLERLFVHTGIFPGPVVAKESATAVEEAVRRNPVAWNAVFFAALATLSAGFWVFSRSKWLVPATVVWLLLVWWLFEDFGVHGLIAWEPSTAPIVGIGMAACFVLGKPRDGTGRRNRLRSRTMLWIMALRQEMDGG